MKHLIVSLLLCTLFLFWVLDKGDTAFYQNAKLGKEVYTKNDTATEEATSSLPLVATTTEGVVASSTKKSVIHVVTPEHVKAVYMSSWVAGTPSVRERLIKLIDTTELNAVVIDVKDNTGVLSWDGRVKDLEALIEELHAKHIYVIARISAFQDPLYVKSHPELAVKTTSGAIWRDHKGVPWIDTGSRQMWEYLVDIGKKSYELGFDELNYDYIRFPTDGNLSLLRFPVSGDRGLTDKRGIVKEFYAYLDEQFSPLGIPISGDVFGIILVNNNETKTLGQDLKDALLHFDYVAPMVYPSHFYAGTAGFQNPAAHPGEIIKYSTRGALSIIEEMASSTEYSSLSTSTLVKKLRPWYQDFDMGATYTKEMVRAQIEAGEKYGVTSWMLWDPSNRYTPSALYTE